MNKIFTLLAGVFALASLPASAANIYITNQGDFDNVALYAWGSGLADTDIFGTWPGAKASADKTIGGETYNLFTTSINGSINLIYNYDGGSSQLKDLNITVENNKDYYFAAYPTGLKVVENPENGLTVPDPFTLYLHNRTSWKSVYVYAWANEKPELFGGWPGAEPNGKATVSGIEYLTYELPASGNSYNFIFNDNDNKKVEGLSIVPDKDIFVSLTDTGVECIDDPRLTYHYLYVEDKTGWDAFYIYAYNAAGAPELFGGWPGTMASGEKIVNGRTFLVFPMVETETDYNLIFTANNGTQYDAFSIVPNRDYYIIANPASAEEDFAAGVYEIAADSDIEPVYYNLQGVKIARPANGLYIEKRGESVRKIIL